MDVPDELITPFQKALYSYKDGYMAARNLASRSRVEYENDVVQFLLFLQDLKVRDLKKIERRHIEAYLAELDRQRLAGVTRRKKLTIIRTFFDWLKANDRIAANPVKAVVPPQREDKEPRLLSKDEYQRLLAIVQKPRDQAIIQLLLQTGIRLSEIARRLYQILTSPSASPRMPWGPWGSLEKVERPAQCFSTVKPAKPWQPGSRYD